MIRMSMLPLLAKCRAAAGESEGAPRVSGDAAALGTAFHTLAEMFIHQGREVAESEVPRVAAAYVVREADLRELLTALQEEPAGAWLDDVLTEQEVVLGGTPEAPLLVGHLDYVRRHEFGLVVEDWKTTAWPGLGEDAADQLQINAYAVAAYRKLGGPPRVEMELVYIRDQGRPRHKAVLEGEEEIAAMEEKVLAVASEAEAQRDPVKREYRTGEHCRFCPARGQCAGLSITAAVAVQLATTSKCPIVTRDNASQVYETWKLVGTVADAAKDAVKALVEADGPIPLPDGKVLEIRDRNMPARTLRAGVQKVLGIYKVRKEGA